MFSMLQAGVRPGLDPEPEGEQWPTESESTVQEQSWLRVGVEATAPGLGWSQVPAAA